MYPPLVTFFGNWGEVMGKIYRDVLEVVNGNRNPGERRITPWTVVILREEKMAKCKGGKKKKGK
jgi:hypothetical protein